MKFLAEKDVVKGRVCVCVGTRPSFIKMAPIIKELERRSFDYKILHSGQHYSPELNIYDGLNLPEPDHYIEGLRKCKLHGKQTAVILREAEKYFLEVKPEVVLVCADANFNFACGLAARKLRLTLGHVESGLRSYDWRTPEEHNRRMLDHISDVLFAPTKHAMDNLMIENVQGNSFLTGNTIVEALSQYLPKQQRTKEIILVTLHREENVDDPKVLKDLIVAVKRIADEFDTMVVFPLHLRTINRLKEYSLSEQFRNHPLISGLRPKPYIEFLELLLRSRFVLTDSGGVQEEACILGVPCVVLRENTDRPESVSVGAAKVVGTNPDKILLAAKELDGRSGWKNPFDPYGDGKIARRIMDCLKIFMH